jgi:glycosyltransferase involved in cell wall biosynthesis
LKIILSHSGKQHSYQVAKAMNNLHVLEKFYTSGYAGASLQWLSKHLPGDPLQRRYIDGLPTDQVSAHWSFELKEHSIRKILRDPIRARLAVYDRDVRFDQLMSKILRKKKATHFWGFQGSCFESLSSARDSGKKAVVELATAHVTEAKKILGEESTLHPPWASTIDNFDFPPAYEKRLEQEPIVADWVIAASDFTRRTLIHAGIANEKIKVLPLGFSIDHIAYDANVISAYKARPLRVLYAGRVTQRKGIYYLLEAMKHFRANEIELHIVGNLNGAGDLLKPYNSYIHYHGAVAQHAMFEMYQQFDVLALPSLFEGFGLVIVEAMAAGLPVITTSNTIGPELIEENVNGKIVPIRDIEAILRALQFFASMDIDQQKKMKAAARNSAEAFSWERYQMKLGNLLSVL